MYSMVLMMALASGPDTATCGGRGGCHGAQAACCSAPVTYVSTGCQGSSCHGSSCHGGGLFHRNNGCTGGSSCHGGGLFHRNNGCQGSTSCFAPVATSCCGGGVIITPAARPRLRCRLRPRRR